jgi:predicted NBD/HSP70 family sugar kinase
MAQRDPGALRVHNTAEILRLIRGAGTISRADLAKATRLTRKTVSEIALTLLTRGWVRETGKGESSGGKRPILMELNRTSVQAIGLDLSDGDRVRGVRCDFSGEPLAAREWAVSGASIYEVAVSAARELASDVPRKSIAGIGVAVSGLVDRAANRVAFSTHFPADSENFAARLSALRSGSVILENATNAATALELQQGALRGIQHGVYIHTARGVGAGLVAGGQIYTGGQLGAGEIGQIRLPGEKSILEDLLSEQALCDRASALAGAATSRILPQDLPLHLKSGAPALQTALSENARLMAWGVSALVNIFAPETVVLGGRMLGYGETWHQAFRDEFASQVLPIFRDRIAIRLSPYGQWAVSRGACELILDRLVSGLNP